MAKAVYRVLVDWNNDGDYLDATDLQPVLDRGLDILAGRDTPRQFAPVKPGDVAWVADNGDSRFSDPAGAIGASLVPGRKVRVEVDRPNSDGTTTTVPLFTGYVDTWDVNLDQWPQVTAAFEAVDQLARLADTKVYLPLSQGLRTDQAVQAVLDNVGGIGSNLDQGWTTLGYWWTNGESALDALNALAQHEGGYVYLDQSGVLQFRNRYASLDYPRSATVQATYGTTGIAVQNLKPRYKVWEVYNRVTVTIEARTQDAALSTVWQFSDTLNLGPNQALTLHASGQDPFTGALCQAGTDYTVTAGSLVSVTLTQSSGQVAILALTAGANGATVAGLQVRAYAVTKQAVQSFVSEDTTSQAQYGLRPLDLDLSFLGSPNDGLAASQYLLARYKDPVPAVDLKVLAGTGAYSAGLAALIDSSIGDRVAVVLPGVGVNWEGFVLAQRHTIHQTAHQTVLTVEKSAVQQAVFTLDSDVYGILDGDQTLLGW